VDGTEFGFAACLRFNTPVVGNLQFQLLPPMEPVTWNLTWRHQELDTKLNRFQAVSSDLFPYALMLFGGFKGTPHGPVPGLVGGQGVFNLNELSNETGDVTFEFQGVVTKSCAPAPD
jgi:hypothetical protein